MKTTTSKPRRRRRRATIALFAATAALAGGAQALAPSPASALDGTGVQTCTIFIFIDCGDDHSQDPGTGGGGGSPTPTATTDDVSYTSTKLADKALQKQVKAFVMDKTGEGWELPKFAQGDDYWTILGMRSRFRACSSRKTQIRHRIREILGDVVFDDVANSGDRELESLREDFNNNQCINVLNGKWDKVDWDN